MQSLKPKMEIAAPPVTALGAFSRQPQIRSRKTRKGLLREQEKDFALVAIEPRRASKKKPRHKNSHPLVYKIDPEKRPRVHSSAFSLVLARAPSKTKKHPAKIITWAHLGGKWISGELAATLRCKRLHYQHRRRACSFLLSCVPAWVSAGETPPASCNRHNNHRRACSFLLPSYSASRVGANGERRHGCHATATATTAEPVASSSFRTPLPEWVPTARYATGVMQAYSFLLSCSCLRVGCQRGANATGDMQPRQQPPPSPWLPPFVCLASVPTGETSPMSCAVRWADVAVPRRLGKTDLGRTG